MTERLLQFIWQFQYFNLTDLRLTNGDSLNILYPGNFNTNQGADFLEARIRVAETILVGNIELHVAAEDWCKHAHEDDPNYSNIILHVVWTVGESEYELPTLILQPQVSKILLERYEQLMYSQSFVACASLVKTIPVIILSKWKERLIAGRLERKLGQINQHLIQTKEFWEEVFWQVLARNFGTKVNAEAFESIACSLPLRILTRHKNQIHQLEALLLGQAGMLNRNFNEEYPAMLKKEYLFLKRKYGLKPVHQPLHLLRMRPGNFPTLRLAQLAMLIHKSSHLFSIIKEAETVVELRKMFRLSANAYWNYHYLLDEPSAFKEKQIGEQMINSIVINIIVPILFAYGQHHKSFHFCEKAFKLLEETPKEDNLIIRKWESLGMENKNAWDSQSLLELKAQFCDQKRCLECSIGNFLLRNNN